MAIYVRTDGVWTEVTPSVNSDGTYKNVTDGWVRVDGAWEQFYRRVRIKLSEIDFQQQYLVSLAVRRNGAIAAVNILNEDYEVRTDEWCEVGRTSTIGDGYEARLTADVGSWDTPVNTAVGSWVPITSDLLWSLLVNSEFRGTLEIRQAGQSAILATAPVHLKTDDLYLGGPF